LGWPIDKVPIALAQQVLEGARFICRMAGITLAGGHSIESTEPFFGLSVNGRVHRSHLKRNHTAKEGDLLFLTKPLGVGMVLAAAKRNVVQPSDLEIAVHQMMELNRIGEKFGRLEGVTAMTDVTGFGLMGHALEMCDDGRLTMEIDFENLPQLASNTSLISQSIYPDMTMKNYSALAAHAAPLSMQQLMVLCDPQTSGGLLVAVNPQHLESYQAVVSDFGLQGIAGQCMGRMTAPQEKAIVLR